MQSVGLLLITGLCGMFVSTNGLKCYKCSWLEPCGATDKLDDMPTIECGAAGAGAAAPGASAAPSAPPALRFLREIGSNSNSNHPRPSFAKLADAKVHYCYKVEVTKDGKTKFDRGCQNTDKTDSCVVIDKAKEATAVAGACTACDSDNCNAASITAVSVSCALLSAMLVARIMFFHTK